MNSLDQEKHDVNESTKHHVDEGNGLDNHPPQWKNVFHDDHRADLSKSGITPETAAELDIRTVTPQFIAKHLGFNDKRITSILCFPYHGENGFCRDKIWPTNLKDKDGHGLRYLQRKTKPGEVGCRLYVPPLARSVLQDAEIPLRFTEGEKKTAKANQEGYPTIGLGGLWNFTHDGALLPRFDDIALNGRTVFLVPDADAWERQDLLKAVYRLGKLLEARGAHVLVECLPDLPSQGKLDDFLVTAGDHAPVALDALPKLSLTDKRFKSVAKQEERKKEKEAAGLPSISVTNRPLRDVSTDALKALLAKNDPPVLFMRGGYPARILTNEHGRPVIERVEEPALRGYLTRSAEFIRVTAKENKKSGETIFTESHISPPRDVVQDILSLPEKPFPPLLGVVETPVLRPDGTIFSTPGYDPATRLIYRPTPGFALPEIPENPTAEDARRACIWIQEELLHDFPFAEAPDLANFFATLLTPILRPAIKKHVPLALLDKPTPGSGASFLTDLIGTIATGDHAAKLKAPEGRNAEEEWRKRITAFLLDGSPIGVIDNVEEEALSSSSLSILLTSGTWKDRLLGSNSMVTLPVRCTLIATGNNIALRGDLARRCYRVRLDPQVERPWERENFKHEDLMAWTQASRGSLLAAILTMARSWFVAGQPKSEEKLPKLGGFEDWVRIIGGVLAYAELGGFLSNQEALYELVDDEGPEWRKFLDAWYENFGDRWVTIRYFCGVLSTLPPDSALSQALPERVAWDPEKLDSSRIKLGKALKKHAFRVYGQHRLERNTEDKNAKAAEWRVCPLRSGRSGAYSGPR